MLDYIKNPEDIERKSFEIISEGLGEKNEHGLKMDIVKSVIHTTADFEFGEILKLKEDAEKVLLEAFTSGCTIITDTNMMKSGIRKKLTNDLGIKIECFVDCEKVQKEAEEKGITRSMAAVDMAAKIPGRKIFAIGNAPTALYRIIELYNAGVLKPDAVVGVPVGFVGAAKSKEELWNTGISCIITTGNKGGSTIGAAVINVVLKEAVKQIERQQNDI